MHFGVFSDHSIDIWDPFSGGGGGKMVFFGLRHALSGTPGFRVLYGVGDDSKYLARANGFETPNLVT